MITKALFTHAALLFLVATPARAAIVLSGDFIDGTPTLTITEDIVFNITKGGDARKIVFDEWTTTDNDVSFTYPQSRLELSYQINGTGGTIPLQVLIEDSSYNYGKVTKNDGKMGFDPLPVLTGQTFTILAGSYAYDANPDFNPLLIDTVFTGDVFIADDDNQYLSNIVTVPEPSTALLGALSLLPLLCRRRYKRG